MKSDKIEPSYESAPAPIENDLPPMSSYDDDLIQDGNAMNNQIIESELNHITDEELQASAPSDNSTAEIAYNKEHRWNVIGIKAEGDGEVLFSSEDPHEVIEALNGYDYLKKDGYKLEVRDSKTTELAYALGGPERSINYSSPEFEKSLALLPADNNIHAENINPTPNVFQDDEPNIKAEEQTSKLTEIDLDQKIDDKKWDGNVNNPKSEGLDKELEQEVGIETQSHQKPVTSYKQVMSPEDKISALEAKLSMLSQSQRGPGQSENGLYSLTAAPFRLIGGFVRALTQKKSQQEPANTNGVVGAEPGIGTAAKVANLSIVENLKSANEAVWSERFSRRDISLLNRDMTRANSAIDRVKETPYYKKYQEIKASGMKMTPGNQIELDKLKGQPEFKDAANSAFNSINEVQSRGSRIASNKGLNDNDKKDLSSKISEFSKQAKKSLEGMPADENQKALMERINEAIQRILAILFRSKNKKQANEPTPGVN